jgi:hypothetical protein
MDILGLGRFNEPVTLGPAARNKGDRWFRKCIDGQFGRFVAPSLREAL